VTHIKQLIICLTFFAQSERLSILRKTIAGYEGIAARTLIYIFTNQEDETSLESALAPLPEAFELRIIIPRHIGHPYLLAWSHREILELIAKQDDDCYFLYTEDDLSLTASNISYWLEYRPLVAEYGFYPSFIRVERDASQWVSTDCLSPITFSQQPFLLLDSGDCFVNLPNPYQGLYFLDPPMIQEMVRSPAMSPDFGAWFIREKAAQGLTFVNVPMGFSSRNIARIDPTTLTIDRRAWIHHLPNNYAQNDASPFGTVPMYSLFEDKSLMRHLFSG